MAKLPPSVAAFLAGRRFVVAGVSRSSDQTANIVFRKLRACGYEVVPMNPHAESLEGVRCYPDLGSVPGTVDGVVVVTHPGIAAEVVRQAAARDIRRVWFHRSLDAGSVSDEALRECAAHGITPIVGGCPLMYCEPVDVAHRCLRWCLALGGRVPR